MDDFNLVRDLADQETIAEGNASREIARLVKVYGRANWRKRKGFGSVRMPSGQTRRAELHWYEAHGVGRKELRIKRFVD